jgi:hypothetical protein
MIGPDALLPESRYAVFVRTPNAYAAPESRVTPQKSVRDCLDEELISIDALSVRDPERRLRRVLQGAQRDIADAISAQL